MPEVRAFFDRYRLARLEALMSTSEHTFQQVKAILGKLDRSIDEAREKRLEGEAAKPVEKPEGVDTRPSLSSSGRPLARPMAPRPAPGDEPDKTSAFKRWE